MSVSKPQTTPSARIAKKIRSNNEYWQQVEGYVSAHTEVQFSHAICPDCYKKHIQPELDKIKK